MKPFEPAPPAKDMKVRLKHNEFRDLVNELRDTADRYGGTDQLRDQLAHTLARRVRPVPDIVEMRPVLERIDARLACDVLSASSTVEVLRLARDEIMVLAEEVRELQGRLEAAENERDALSRMLAESQANDRCAMGYLAEVRAVVGGDDFLDMVQKVKRMAGEQPASSVPEGWEKELFCIQHAMAMNNWNWDSDASNDMKRAAYAAVVRLLTAAPEAKP